MSYAVLFALVLLAFKMRGWRYMPRRVNFTMQAMFLLWAICIAPRNLFWAHWLAWGIFWRLVVRGRLKRAGA